MGIPQFLESSKHVTKAALRAPILITKRQLRFLCSIYRSLKSDYDFSPTDIRLFIAELSAKVKQMEVTPSGVPGLVHVKIGDKTIFWPEVVPPRSLPWLYNEIYNPFDRNPSSYDNPSMRLSCRDWVMDAGAAEGYFSLFALERSVPRVICIEPLSVMRNALEKTLESIKHTAEVTVVTSALGSDAGEANMEIDYNNICDARVNTSAGDAKDDRSESLPRIVERVNIITIDQLAGANSLGENGMIKMDIEGFEMEAIKGATKLLKDHKPALAIAVYHDVENARACAKLVKDANPAYDIQFRGFNDYFSSPRPYMLFAT